MIQAQQLSFATYNNYIRLDLYDKITLQVDRPLIVATSQQTNRSLAFQVSNINYTNKLRYVEMYFITLHSGTQYPLLGMVQFGTIELPYGLYDISIYETTGSGDSLDPTGKLKLYDGLMNMQYIKNSNDAVVYTEYDSTQQQNVYITNTVVF